MSALLSTSALTAFYGDFQALFGIDFEIGAGEIVAIIGANGAGKSTFLRASLDCSKPGGTPSSSTVRPSAACRRTTSLVAESPWFRRAGACFPV